MDSAMKEITEAARAMPPVDEISDLAQEIINCVGEIDELPDGAEKLRRVKKFALELLPDEAADAEEAKQAAEEIAGAFITLLKWDAYLPQQLYVDLHDGIGSWLNDAQWDVNPRLAPVMMPEVLKDIILHGAS